MDIYRDTAYVFPVTNFATNILEHDVLWRTGRVADVFQEGRSSAFYLTKAPEDIGNIQNNKLNNTTFRDFINLKKKDDTVISKVDMGDSTEAPLADIAEPDTLPDQRNTGWNFQSDFPEPEKTEEDKNQIVLDQAENPDQQNINTGKKFKSSHIVPYRVKYSSDYVTSQLDNSLFINKYESFNTTGGVYNTPDLGAMFTVSISDLFEDYRFTGGLRFPTSFSGGEYFLMFNDLKRRLDKKVTWYHQGESAQYNFQPQWYPIVDAGIKSNILEGTLTWPFDVIRSVRGSLSYRSDKVVFLANDTFSLNLPSYRENWLSLRLEYVHDDTYPVMTNILNGMRYKVWFEWYKQFAVNTDAGLDVSAEPGYLGVVGFDFRHYQKIHRQIIWANRFAGGTSFGTQKLIYYLGGVDSWIAPTFNNNIEIDQNAGYAFQTLATNLRGYDQNIRNGNSYAVFNSELRFPIFSYLFNKPIKAEILRNFQIIGFYDIGSAWQGLSPFDEDNPFNNGTIYQPPITVDVNYFRNPVVMGTGVGLRTTIFGYFVRVDRAQSIESNGLGKPKWYFSLSLDF
ncbi:MAG: hypothetical protein R2794_09840 [Chitinophagales bacterium]